MVVPRLMMEKVVPDDGFEFHGMSCIIRLFLVVV
jgi:hypothetical protein